MAVVRLGESYVQRNQIGTLPILAIHPQPTFDIHLHRNLAISYLSAFLSQHQAERTADTIIMMCSLGQEATIWLLST